MTCHRRSHVLLLMDPKGENQKKEKTSSEVNSSACRSTRRKVMVARSKCAAVEAEAEVDCLEVPTFSFHEAQ